ncbi:hypothetical protein C482_03759 [Natrialba chahannaoensis JCM 10990]|uniref:Uncharacterized protein n=1 Tax=Natrialba chahannaoensis JCM 10990 TaxID=1227492 RepID=M0AWZ6_9EURY|nr:hypothetical protein C482_03759 [Natrialba chahannaoensis JCM 10990]
MASLHVVEVSYSTFKLVDNKVPEPLITGEYLLERRDRNISVWIALERKLSVSEVIVFVIERYWIRLSNKFITTIVQEEEQCSIGNVVGGRILNRFVKILEVFHNLWNIERFEYADGVFNDGPVENRNEKIGFSLAMSLVSCPELYPFEYSGGLWISLGCFCESFVYVTNEFPIPVE